MANSVTITKVYELVEDTRKELTSELRRVERKIDDGFVSKVEHSALKTRVKNLERAVYGAASLVVVAVITGLLGLVIRQ